jgi:hypothetical protein
MTVSPASTDASHPRQSFFRLPIAWTAALVITISVAFFALQRSIEVGRLSAPPLYDDVVYLYTAQTLLHAMQHQSWLATLHQFVDQHAPLSTLVAVIGFLMVPHGLIGPYLANCLVLGGFLAGCAGFLRKLPVAGSVGIIAAIAAIPISSLSISEFRPDLAWGFLTGLASVALLRPPVFALGSKSLITIGLLAGLALVSKPSTSPVTGVILGTAFLEAAALRWFAQRRDAERQPLREIARAAGLIGIGALLVAGPVYAVIWRDVYAYIKSALVDFGDQSAVPGDFLFHLLYYSFGASGRLMLGDALWVLLAFWITIICYSAAFFRPLLPRLACYLAVILLAYAIPSQTVVKSPYFGSAFYGLLIVSTAAVLPDVWQNLAERRLFAAIRGPVAGTICGMGALLLVVTNVLHPPLILVYTPEFRKDMQEGSSRIWGSVREQVLEWKAGHSGRDVQNAIVLSPEPITAGALSLYAAIEDVPLRAHGLYYARTLEELTRRLDETDYVVVTDLITMKSQLRGPRLGEALIREMDSRTDFKCILMYLRPAGGTVKVYSRRS